MVAAGTDKLICDLSWRFLRLLRSGSRPARAGEPGRRAARACDGAARPPGRAGWTATCGSSRCWKRGGGPDGGGPVPHAIERGRLGDAAAAPELAALLGATEVSLRSAARQAELLVALPARPGHGAAAGPGGWRSGTTRSPIGRPSARSAWATPARRAAGSGDRRRPRALPCPGARAGGAGAGRAPATAAVSMPWRKRSTTADDVALRRTIMVELGKLGDRRAVPVLLGHLSEVQNRREMVDALGRSAIPSAAGALLEHVRSDDIRPGADRGGPRAGEAGEPPASRRRFRRWRSSDTEPTVRAAALDAARVLQAGQTENRRRCRSAATRGWWRRAASRDRRGFRRRPGRRGSPAPRRGAAPGSAGERASNSAGRVLTRHSTSASSCSLPLPDGRWSGRRG